MGVRGARGVEIAQAMRAAGYDWLFIDLEHGAISLESAAQLCSAALDAGISPIVRVATDALSEGSRLLDNGAQGVIVPHVDTPEQAAEIVRRFRYPPIGRRSMTQTMPFFGFRSMSGADMATPLNALTLVIAMIESSHAVANASHIAAVPGIDALFVGTTDLAAELGVSSNSDPQMIAAYRGVAEACRANRKFAGFGGASGDMLSLGFELGMRFVLGGVDMALLMDAAIQRNLSIRTSFQLATE